jgi:hypothetical protein
MKLRWGDAVQDAQLPYGSAFIAVAFVMARFSDIDGRNCFPAIETVAKLAGCHETTARRQIQRLLSEGYLRVAGKASQHRPTTYSLTIPEGAEQAPQGDPGVAPVVPLNQPRGASDATPENAQGSLRGSAGVSLALPDYRLPTPEEEEEDDATTRSASAPLVASSQAVPESGDSQPESGDDWAAILGRVGEWSGRPITFTPELGRELGLAKARAKWSDGMLVGYLTDKLKSLGAKVQVPGSFLAADLRRNVHGGTHPSPRMQLAEAMWGLAALEAELLRDTWELGSNDPRGGIEDKLEAAEIIPEGEMIPESPWGVKESLVPVATRIIGSACDRARNHLESLRGWERNPERLKYCPACEAPNLPRTVGQTSSGAVWGTYSCLACTRAWEDVLQDAPPPVPVDLFTESS